MYEPLLRDADFLGQNGKRLQVKGKIPLDETDHFFVQIVNHVQSANSNPMPGHWEGFLASESDLNGPLPAISMRYIHTFGLSCGNIGSSLPCQVSYLLGLKWESLWYNKDLFECTGAVVFGFHKIIERRIQEAQMQGEFDDLPGKGKPLCLEDDSQVPEDLRLAYKILKNANCLPPELELKKEIRQMEDMLESIPDEKEKYRQIKRINFKIMQVNMMGKRSPLLEETQIYYNKLVKKFAQNY